MRVPVDENQDDTLLPTPEVLVAPTAERLAELAAELAADPTHNVGESDALQHALSRVRSLEEALQTRTEIGEAIGLLMARYNMSTDEAFATLVRRSSHTNRKVRELAAEMVAEANDASGSCGGVLKSVRLD